LGVSFVSHNDPMSNFAQLRMNTSSDSINDVWSTIWVRVVGEIWRNSIIFNRGVADASEVCSLMQAKVWSWMSVKSCSASVPFSSWCLEPLECMRLVVWGILGWLVWTVLYLLVWWFLLCWIMYLLYKGWSTPEVVRIYILVITDKKKQNFIDSTILNKKEPVSLKDPPLRTTQIT